MSKPQPFQSSLGDCRKCSETSICLQKTRPSWGLKQEAVASGLPQTRTPAHPGPQPVPPRTLSAPTSGPGHPCAGSLAGMPGGSSLSRPPPACVRGPELIKSAPTSTPRTLVPAACVDPRKGTGCGAEKGPGLILSGESQGKSEVAGSGSMSRRYTLHLTYGWRQARVFD